MYKDQLKFKLYKSNQSKIVQKTCPANKILDISVSKRFKTNLRNIRVSRPTPNLQNSK